AFAQYDKKVETFLRKNLKNGSYSQINAKSLENMGKFWEDQVGRRPKPPKQPLYVDRRPPGT
ncbi:MAG TPA: hypothetical protein VF598_00235, partial [Hymenobacter sp.]